MLSQEKFNQVYFKMYDDVVLKLLLSVRWNLWLKLTSEICLRLSEKPKPQ